MRLERLVAESPTDCEPCVLAVLGVQYHPDFVTEVLDRAIAIQVAVVIAAGTFDRVDHVLQMAIDRRECGLVVR